MGKETRQELEDREKGEGCLSHSDKGLPWIEKKQACPTGKLQFKKVKEEASC